MPRMSFPTAAAALAMLAFGAVSSASAQSTFGGTSGSQTTSTGSTQTTSTTTTTTTQTTSTAPTQTNVTGRQIATTQTNDDSGSRNHGGFNGGAAQACGSGGLDFQVMGFGGVAQNVKAVSKAAKYYLENCHCPTATCIADVLDKYADALDALGPQLPPQVADLPAIVRRSAQNVRAARSLSQARAAVGVAIATIDAKLKLLTVSDPDARDEGVRSTRYVADTLTVAQVSLTRVSGL